MVLLVLVEGNKGPDDVLVLVTAYNEPLSFAEWLFIGKCYLDSEASYYPVSKGYLGKAMLLNALNELSHGVPFDRVLERYMLKRKGKKLNILDKRKSKAPKSIEKLREVLGQCLGPGLLVLSVEPMKILRNGWELSKSII